MRKVFGIFTGLLAAALVYVLDNPIPAKSGNLPALGRLADPIAGCWANAEPANKDFGGGLNFPGLHKPAAVWLDTRLVPHIHAADNHDAYYLEGYLHATFRLWQMDMQTRAAAGRISEVIGAKGLDYDRRQRRKGMVYGAENCLKAIEACPETKAMAEAYAEGVNAYIGPLKPKDYPLEYKLMGFAPEKWTTIKTALMLKLMADDLTGYSEQIPMTYLRDHLPDSLLNLYYPARNEGTSPVIPVGTAFEGAGHVSPQAPPHPFVKFDGHVAATAAGSLRDDHEGIGSNNWAVGGARTRSGAAILCNDPHLGLTLPSLWYEVQIQTPDMNVYGVSLPGAPGVVIGFNDSVAWGFTNNYRDVKDFYAIKTVPGEKGKYIFNGKAVPFTPRVEHILVAGGAAVDDTVNYTVHGPVMFDDRFKEPNGFPLPLAVCWMAHRTSNELKAFYLLNRAKSYQDYTDAISFYDCPAQNIAFADRHGSVAIWGQGQFTDAWKGQGRYIMDGSDSSTLWQADIPKKLNPHVLNPERGYVSSANQTVTDSTYPYNYSGYFTEFRAWRINEVLDNLHDATIWDMFALQNDTRSVLARRALPIMLQRLPETVGMADKEAYVALKSWDYNLTADSKPGLFFQVWWYCLYHALWDARFKAVPDGLMPSTERTMHMMESGLEPQNAGVDGPIAVSFKQAADSIAKLAKAGKTAWYEVKNTSVKHLAKLDGFGVEDVKTGGWGNTVNAMKGDHGPSWRMVVEMGAHIDANGVYPGGQSGNPGSKYYADFLNHWIEGKYYKLLFLPNADNASDPAIKYTITANP
jgi:penicillin G amidase